MTKARGKAGGGFGVKVAITGDKEIDKWLREIEPKLSKKHIRKAIRKSLKPVQARAKELAPVGQQEVRRGKVVRLGGETKKGIKIVASKARKGVIKLVVMVASGNYIGGEFYASFSELGSKHQPARPFLRPALREKEDEALAIFTAEIRKAMEAESKKGAA